MARILEAPQQLEEEEIQSLYEWVDEFPLSRPKRNITRDFADGAMVAEIIKHYFPRMVELHNYPQAHALQKKLENWNTLNKKVFRKMGFQISRNDIDQVINCAPDAIERVLKLVREKITEFKERGRSPEITSKKSPSAPPKPKQSQQERKDAPEKDKMIQELRETVEVLEQKIMKMEQLLKLKDSKIQMLSNKLAAAGIN